MSESHDLIADGVRAERAGAMDRALSCYETVASTTNDPALLAEALTREADVHRARCDWTRALDAARRAQAAAESVSPPLLRQLDEAVNAEANVLMCSGDFIAAATKYELIAAKSGDPRVRGMALQNLGSIYAQCGQPAAAERAFAESLENFTLAGYARGQGIALNNMGRLALDQSKCPEGRELLQEALAVAREVEDLDLVALVSLNLAGAYCTDGQLDRAQDLAMTALGYYRDSENSWRQIECLRLIGDINARCEDVTNATRCYNLALRLAEEIGSEPEMLVSQERLAALSPPRAT